MAKQDGVRQRKLLMAVQTNLQWWGPRSDVRLGLHGGGAFANLHTGSHGNTAGDIPAAAATTGWNLAAFDTANAFTRVRTPSWMWGWFLAPPLYAFEVWAVPPDDLKATLSPSSVVVAQYMRLVTGSNHSVTVLMAMGLAAAGRTLRADRVLHRDAASAWVAGAVLTALAGEVDPSVVGSVLVLCSCCFEGPRKFS